MTFSAFCFVFFLIGLFGPMFGAATDEDQQHRPDLNVQPDAFALTRNYALVLMGVIIAIGLLAGIIWPAPTGIPAGIAGDLLSGLLTGTFFGSIACAMLCEARTDQVLT